MRNKKAFRKTNFKTTAKATSVDKMSNPNNQKIQNLKRTPMINLKKKRKNKKRKKKKEKENHHKNRSHLLTRDHTIKMVRRIKKKIRRNSYSRMTTCNTMPKTNNAF